MRNKNSKFFEGQFTSKTKFTYFSCGLEAAEMSTYYWI